jgi:membrane protease YdiL (CAAX protease family)
MGERRRRKGWMSVTFRRRGIEDLLPTGWTNAGPIGKTDRMNWALASFAPLTVGVVLAATGNLPAGIVAYHVLCAAAIAARRARVRTFFRLDAAILRWTAGTTLVIVGTLLLAPLVRDPSSYRGLFRSVVFPKGDPSTLFPVFAAYTLIVHAPLEEIFWRAVVLDPEWSPPRTAVPGNAVFFYLLHAVPMRLILGPEAFLLAAPAGLAGAVWAIVTIRSRSLWPGLVSHWGADAVILGMMWFYFIR